MGSWIGSRSRRLRLLLLASIAAALVVTSSALAGSGFNGVFNLGVSNPINGFITVITGSNPSSPTLVARNTSSSNSSSGLKGIASHTSGAGTVGVWGQNLTTGGAGSGVYGQHMGSGIGVYGLASNGGRGVFGYSAGGIGVQGSTNGGYGVYGAQASTSSTLGGVAAFSASNGAGATALSATLSPTTAGNASAAIRGINKGTNGLGEGVVGIHAGSGIGVHGVAPSGTGVMGTTGSGFGVYALTTGTGAALRVQGRAGFSRSGIVTIANPATSTTISYSLSAASMVLATVQGAPHGVWVESAETNVATQKLTIHLNATPSSGSVRVAYFVLN
jgi:hypothetical protein